MKKPIKPFLVTIKRESRGNRFWKNMFILRKSSILQYLKTYTDLEAYLGIPNDGLDGHMMETEDPVCVLIC